MLFCADEWDTVRELQYAVELHLVNLGDPGPTKLQEWHELMCEEGKPCKLFCTVNVLLQDWRHTIWLLMVENPMAVDSTED